VDQEITVRGLSQVRAGFKQVASEANDVARDTTKLAGDLLVSTTQPKVPFVTGAARRSLVAKASGGSVRVQAGGTLAPHYAWLDFGGRAGRNLAVLRPVIREGRYLYPTLREIQPRIEAQGTRVVEQMIRRAGLED
jgi:hypothetical protein